MDSYLLHLHAGAELSGGVLGLQHQRRVRRENHLSNRKEESVLINICVCARVVRLEFVCYCKKHNMQVCVCVCMRTCMQYLYIREVQL